ncbi:MAG: hypothetical protein AB8G11_26110 [Saprospiraceae bacterium]
MASAQEESLLVDSKWRINVFPLNVGYEHRIGQKSTVYAQAGLNLDRFRNVADSTASAWRQFFTGRTLALTFNTSAEYRYYYNIEKRHAKGKNIAYNSANFIGGRVETLLPPLWKASDNEIVKENGVIISGTWGMQRVQRGGRFVYSFRVGPALRLTNEGFTPDLAANLTFGFILGEKKPNL